MKQTIIAISGRKGAGKNTLSRFISLYYGYRQCYPNSSFSYGAARDFLESNDTLHNYVKSNVGEYSFADTLKDFCIETLGLRREQCYGTDEEKNQPTEYLWENTDPILMQKFEKTFGKKKGPMTGREIMQIFGTELIRGTFGNVWAMATIRRIWSDKLPLAIITDNRFPNEVESILRVGGYVIRLTRSPFGYCDCHASEASLDKYNWDQPNCHVLDNSCLNIDDQNIKIIPIIEKIIFAN
jgi:hypothetical protein